MLGAALTAAAWVAHASSPAPHPDSAGASRAGGANSNSKAADAGANPVVPSDAGPVPGSLPDPAPLVTRQQWVVELAYQEREVVLRSARRLVLERAVPSARMMGRFALEIYVGPELLDRIRFDFPLLGAGEYEHANRWNAPPQFETHLRSSTAVMIPHSERATRLVLLDRASGRIWNLQWPLPAGTDPGHPDGGAAARP